VLKVRGIRDDGPDRMIARVGADDAPAPREKLERLAAVANRLLVENRLAGGFRVAGEGEIALEVPAAARHFLHDGIVFAALDAVNDPVKNPTLTLLSEENPER
jgi:hypothetical protein